MAGRPAAKVDAAFFDCWGPEMAWALGLLFTDGHLRPRVGYTAPRIYFTQKTPELVYKLRALLGSDTTIHYRARQQYNGKTAGAVFQIAIANARLGARLMELGITPRKSLTIQFPEVPADFTRHFIRGCWDGDGSILPRANGRYLTAKFGCGSLRFVEGMLDTLSRDGFAKRRIYRLRCYGREMDYYYFVYSKSSHLDHLFRYLYEGVGEHMYLGRKHDAFSIYMRAAAREL